VNYQSTEATVVCKRVVAAIAQWKYNSHNFQSTKALNSGVRGRTPHLCSVDYPSACLSPSQKTTCHPVRRPLHGSIRFRLRKFGNERTKATMGEIAVLVFWLRRCLKTASCPNECNSLLTMVERVTVLHGDSTVRLNNGDASIFVIEVWRAKDSLLALSIQ
jgi:hypothetical protein